MNRPQHPHLSERRQPRIVFFCLLSVVCSLWSAVVFAEPRYAHVAGAFYPAEPDQLRALVTRLLDDQPAPRPEPPRMLIVPHAGYPYSGIVAARGFRQLQGQAFDAVVVIGFTHRYAFPGTSVDTREAFVTPLGAIPIDQDAVAVLLRQPGLRHVEEAHASGEHSMEVMLPFLQVSLGAFRLVPVLMGGSSEADAAALANALAQLSARGRYLFIFSTDLSHYHPYDDALKRDETTVSAMLYETPQAVERLFRHGALEACGRGPILTSLLLANRLGYLKPELLRYANSGDTTGEKARVVGYAAIGLYERPPLATDQTLSPEAGRALVQHARLALQMHFDPKLRPKGPPGLGAFEELRRSHGVFVTLRRKNHELRGCIGRIETDEPLATLLPIVAREAALRDARFSPLAADELPDVSVEVSVLTPPVKIHSADAIVAGRDGVILRQGRHSGVFLPEVWQETGWTRVEFLRELASQKAGLDPDAWQTAELFTFQAQAFEEQ